MHNLSTITATAKTYGKHELRAATPTGIRPLVVEEGTSDPKAAEAVRMNGGSGVSVGMAISNSSSSTALSVPLAVLRPGTPSPMAMRQPLSGRLPPLNMPQGSASPMPDGSALSVRGSSPIMLRPLDPLKLNATPLSVQQPGTLIQQSSAPQSLNSTVVNEVHAISYDRRRRPSSAQLPLSRKLIHGHIPIKSAHNGAQGLGIHKPLPAISEPSKTRSHGSRRSRSSRSKSSPWRFALKCLLISLFLSIPVVIFILMMALSGGFSTVENINPEVTTGTNSSNTALVNGNPIGTA